MVLDFLKAEKERKVNDIKTLNVTSEGKLTGTLAAGGATKDNLQSELIGKSLSDFYNLMINGSLYVTVHTKDFPNGEIRGNSFVPMDDLFPADSEIWIDCCMVHRSIAKATTNKQRNEMILEFVRHHDACNKETVIKGLNGKISRVTILRLIDGLVEDGVLELKTEKDNSRDHKLSIVKDNVIYSIPKQLQDFKRYYFELCDRVIEILKDEKSELVINRKIVFKPQSKTCYIIRSICSK